MPSCRTGGAWAWSDRQRGSGTAQGASRSVGFVNDDTPNVTGKPPRFGITLSPLERSSGASSASRTNTLDPAGRIRIPGVRPGKYEILIEDQALPRRFYTGEIIARKAVEVEGPGFTVLEIRLDAGSITGQGRLPANGHWKDGEFAIGYAFAVGELNGSTRRAAADERNNFCLRYLPPDSYRRWFWHAVLGWCEFGAVEVDAVSRDVGKARLSEGATLTGRIEIVGVCSVPTEIRVRDQDGFEFSSIQFRGGLEAGFQVTHLWPGQGTVRLMSGEEEIAPTTVKIEDASSVSVVLALKQGFVLRAGTGE